MKILETTVSIDSKNKTIVISKEDRKIKPVKIPDPVSEEWIKKLTQAIAKRNYINPDTAEIYSKELKKAIDERLSVEPKGITHLHQVLEEPLEEIEEPPKPSEVPAQAIQPSVPQLEETTKEFIESLNERERQMFNHISQKYSKPSNELAKYYFGESERLKCPPNLLIYRDWRKFGGEAVRRIVLMNENYNIIKFFTAAGNYFPVNTCIQLVTNIPLPFKRGRVIGTSNKSLLMFFTDYIELVNGSVTVRKVIQEPRIDGIEKIPETKEIYQKIPKAENALTPLDKMHSLDKIMELCKQYNAGIEEVATGVIDAIYVSDNSLRQAIHIGSPNIHPNRVTVWIETQRYTLTENDVHKVCRVFGFFQHRMSEYMGQTYDNLNVNAYHLIIEE